MQPDEQVNILLVDDRPENLLALETVLGDMGENLVKANSGAEALRCVLKQDFAVILLDVQMPEMDGFETAALIRERERSRHTPIIFLTAIDKSAEHVARGYGTGAVDYIFKPFVPEILRAKVSVFVDLYKMGQALERSEAALRELNATLEQQVAERTAAAILAEAKYRHIFENAAEGIFQSTFEGRILTANPALARMLGYASPEEFIASVDDLGKQVYARAEQRAEFTRLVQAHGRVLGFETQVKRKDGSLMWVSVNASLIPGRDDAPHHVDGTIENITDRKQAEEQIHRQFQQLQALRTIDNAITSSLDLNLTLNIVLEQATTQLNVDAADVLLLRPALQTLEYAAGRGFRSQAIARTHLRVGEGQAGRAALERRRIEIPNVVASGAQFAQPELLAGEDIAAYYAVPLIAKGKVNGVLEVYCRALLNPDTEWLAFLETLAGQTAIAIDNLALFQGLQRSNLELVLAYNTTIEGWSRALDLRDKETEGHTQRVTEMTLQLARAMGLSEQELVHVRRGALLHDIGKMGVPDSILHKPGKLTEEEWEVMRRHPQLAYEMLTPITYLKSALDIPYCHHEKWDGTGYPSGLKGEQIPLAARLFAVADVWDALTSDRPYRQAWSKEKAREYIREQAGKHFDPKVAKVFLRELANK